MRFALSPRHFRQSLDRTEAMADGTFTVHQKDAVGYGAEQRRVLLFAESQRFDGARTAHDIANAVRQERPVYGFDDEIRRAGLVRLIDRDGVIAAGHHYYG